MEELGQIDYDFIIINIIKTKKIEEVIELLFKAGVQKEKIIPFYWFDFIGIQNPIKKYMKLKNKTFEGILTGMSYAMDGFYPQEFSRRFFNLSGRGMDLYYHYYALKKLLNDIEQSENLYRSLKYIALELPYFIFNYDVTKEFSLLKYRMSAFETLDRFHHALETEEGRLLLERYRSYCRIFGRKLEAAESVWNTIPLSYIEKKQVDNNPPDYFFGEHPGTIEENKEIFRNIMQMLYDYNRDLKVAVVVFPQRDRAIEWKEQEKQKKIFYDAIEPCLEKYKNLMLFDYFEEFKDKSEYFYDSGHLTCKGAIEFSSILENKFMNKFY